MARHHFRELALTKEPATGYLLPVANPTVTVYEPGTTTPLAQTLYAERTGGTTRSNPFSGGSDGTVDFWLDTDQDVSIHAVGTSPLGSLTLDYIATVGSVSDLVRSFTYTADDVLTYEPAPLADARSLLDAEIMDWHVVKIRGATGDGTTDDTDAFQDAYDAWPVPSGARTRGIVFEVGPGDYLIGDLVLDSPNPVLIRGCGPGVTNLIPSATSGIAIRVGTSGGTAGTDGPTRFGLMNLSITPNATNRSASSWLLAVYNTPVVFIRDVIYGRGTGGGFRFESVNEVLMTDVDGSSTDGSTGDTCLRLISSQGTFKGVKLAMAGGNVGRAPVVHISGTVTTSRFDNCLFGGWGPRAQLNIVSITGSGSAFTVTSAAHGFAAGDLFVIRGTSTSYDSVWRAASVTATTLVVSSALVTSVGAVGTVESVAASFLVENSGGPINEGVISGCFTANQAAAPYGTTGFYFDGKRSTSNAIEGWVLSGNWYDGGRTGVLISGTTTGSAPTVYGFKITGGEFSQITRGIHIDQASGIVIDGVQCGASGGTAPADDGVSASAGVYIWAGLTSALSRGIVIDGSQLGYSRDMTVEPGGTLTKYGVLVDGAVELLTIGDSCQIAGSTAKIGTINSALANGRHWRIQNPLGGVGTTLPIAASAILPTIASASSIAATVGHDHFLISGTTGISSITGGWVGRRITLMFISGLTLGTGGNLAIGSGVAVAAGRTASLWFDGTSWYVQ